MNLNTKAALIVAIITFLQADHSCCRLMEAIGVGHIVRMRNEKGGLTREGQLVMALFFAMVTYAVMSIRK